MEGNKMKMREALLEIAKVADDWERHSPTKASALDRIYELANAALSEPPRNCDLVNSYDEAEEKFCSYCVQYETCGSCPLFDPKDCRARWLLATATSLSTKKGEN